MIANAIENLLLVQLQAPRAAALTCPAVMTRAGGWLLGIWSALA